MHEIIKNQIELTFIPDVALAHFIRLFQPWYEEREDNNLPALYSNMINQDEDTQACLTDLFIDISVYHYASGSQQVEFIPNEFPVDTQRWLDYVMEQQWEAYNDTFDSLEYAFYCDLKKYMNFHNMFYIDSYEWEPTFNGNSVYNNMPSVEVW